MTPGIENLSDSDLAIVALRLFPPGVRASVIEDAEFRRLFGLGTDAVIRFNQIGVEFTRSELFAAVRQVLDGTPEREVVSKDKRTWRVFLGSRGLALSNADAEVTLPDFASMSSDSNRRMEWFENQNKNGRLDEERRRKWRALLLQRSADDEEVDQLFEEFRLTPEYVASSVREQLGQSSFGAKELVPADLRYFERLVGPPTDESDVGVFLSRSISSLFQGWIQRDGREGLKAALLLSVHTAVSDGIDLGALRPDEVLEVFQWIAAGGDRMSQVGAIECGLRHLPALPQLGPSIVTMTRAIAADDPHDPGGRLQLLTGLIALVEGQVARIRIARGRPPYWRRLASIAHAGVIEREVIAVGLAPSTVAQWALGNGGAIYYQQTLIDLRREPRWLPDFVSPEQLRAEFVGRIASAADRHREGIKDPELASLLSGAEPGTIRSLRSFPHSYLPGPLEGGSESKIEIPPEMEAAIRSNLEANDLTTGSFIALVNSALIYRINPGLSELAAQGLRRVGYQLRKVNANSDPYPLLNGLATVAAVTRSTELAEGVRILSRVARRRSGTTLLPDSSARIGLVAAAANEDVVAWSNFVGDWLTELAFGELTREQAASLLDDIHTLSHLEPMLWETCGRAEGALSAYVGSFPDGVPLDRLPG